MRGMQSGVREGEKREERRGEEGVLRKIKFTAKLIVSCSNSTEFKQKNGFYRFGE